MKIILNDIKPSDMEGIRKFLLEYGLRTHGLLNISIAPNMKELFKANFGNRYFEKSGFGWKLPASVSEEFCFGFDGGTEPNPTEWGTAVSDKNIVCGVLRLDITVEHDFRWKTIIIEEPGAFNRMTYGSFR